MQYNNHPRLTHDFSRQFAKVACPDSDARASALPAFIALHKMKAQLRLYTALNQCLQMKPRMGLLNKPAQFGASTPSGQGATGVIIGYDEKGQLRCIASNALPKPTACKQTATMPPDLINKLSARGIAATEQLDLMHQAISIAAKDRMDWVERFDVMPDSALIREAQLVQSPKRPTTPAPLPFSAPTLWRKVAAGTFPKPHKLSARVTAWRLGAVREWINAQTAG